MTAALRIRIEELEEEIRQLKAAFAPKVAFPLSWKLDERESAILSALFHAKGSYITHEALLLLLVRYDDDADEYTTRTWIGRLRRKVEPRGIAIATRHTQGYQLEAAGRAVVAEALGIAPAAPIVEAARPVHPRGWTEAEDAIVRAGYERGSILTVIRAELIGVGHKARSLGSISTRGQTLGFAGDRKAPNWTPPEDAILRAGYEDGLAYTQIRLKLAEAGFNRNRPAIGMRLISLGVAGDRVRTWTRPELAIVRAGVEKGLTHLAIRRELLRNGFERGRTAVTKQAAFMSGQSRGERPWTDAEVTILRARYAEKVPQRAIAAELGRGVGGIASKASHLGLKQRHRWTEAERARLSRGFEAGETLDAVCQDIDRPKSNVAEEARRMGLQFRPAPRRQQAQDVAA
jgi:hypothetical protein